MLYSEYYGWEPRITNDDMVEFLEICLKKAGADSMITPREMLRDYLTVLNILMQNPDADFMTVVGKSTASVGAENVLKDTDKPQNAAMADNSDILDVLEF